MIHGLQMVLDAKAGGRLAFALMLCICHGEWVDLIRCRRKIVYVGTKGDLTESDLTSTRMISELLLAAHGKTRPSLTAAGIVRTLICFCRPRKQRL